MAQNETQSTLPRGVINLRASDVEACRICLETNNKLHCLQLTHLETFMEAIGGFTNQCGGLPNYICYECAQILLKCYKLILKSETSQATLLDIFHQNGQITKALVKGQNRSQLNLKSSLDCHHNDSNTSDFIIPETKTNIDIEMKIEDKENEVETNKENTEMEALDDSLEEIKEDIPIIELSDDETSDDFISLAPYKEVEVENKKKRGGLRGISQKFQPKPLSNKRKKKAEKRKWRQNMDSIEKSEDSTNSDEFPPELKLIQENINIVLKTVYSLCPHRPCPHWWEQQELIKIIKNCSRCPPSAPSPQHGGSVPKEERS